MRRSYCSGSSLPDKCKHSSVFTNTAFVYFGLEKPHVITPNQLETYFLDSGTYSTSKDVPIDVCNSIYPYMSTRKVEAGL